MARPSATDRLARILAIVPWIAEQGSASIDELCERFGVTRAELVADLAIVPMVGVYPYTPDSLIELIVDDDHVAITYGNFFARPLRLSKEEAVTIVAAGVGASAQPGHDPDGPLARGLTKLATVLGIDLDDDVEVVLGRAASDTRRLVEDAVARHRVLHLHYFSHARDEATERDVEPLRLHHVEGAWYLDAHCRTSEAHRVFRLDRITQVAVTEEGFDPAARELPAPMGPSQVFAADADLPRVTLALGPGGRWVADQYPVESRTETADGGLEVTLAVSARPWLDRLLLQLGPEGRVLRVGRDPDGVLDGAGTEAARSILARYA